MFSLTTLRKSVAFANMTSAEWRKRIALATAKSCGRTAFG